MFSSWGGFSTERLSELAGDVREALTEAIEETRADVAGDEAPIDDEGSSPAEEGGQGGDTEDASVSLRELAEAKRRIAQLEDELSMERERVESLSCVVRKPRPPSPLTPPPVAARHFCARKRSALTACRAS